MNHPFLNKKILPLYSSVWVIPIVSQTWAIHIYAKIDLDIAFTEAIIGNSIFFFLGLSLWFFVKYTLNDVVGWYKVLLNLFTAGVLIETIWIVTEHTILSALYGDNEIYMSYLNRTTPWRLMFGFMVYILILLSYYLRILYDNLREKIETESKLNEMLKDSQLNLLKSQINPHFLFNSLNSANWLTKVSPDKAGEMIVSLSEYLRYSIAGGHRTLSPLEAEIENIQRYISIERIRFGEKLTVNFELSKEALQTKIPAMLLQPLYENAIKHGVYESTNPVWIDTKIEKKGDFVKIEIKNSFEQYTSYRKGNNLGIKNIRQRLALIYGETATFITDKTDQIFTVTIIIPAICPSEY